MRTAYGISIDYNAVLTRFDQCNVQPWSLVHIYLQGELLELSFAMPSPHIRPG